jgi:outer membrane immunogenic protein
MKRQLMATVSCLALASAASAADLPVAMPVKAPPPPVVVNLWAGPYVGINGGVVWHRLKTDVFSLGGNPYDSATVNVTGGTIGGTIGYNWQSQNFVFGLEADANWVSAKGSESKTPFASLIANATYTTKLEWLATVRARAGVTLFGPRTLVYATGGLAVGGVENEWRFTGTPAPQNSFDGTRVGWTAGGGIEHFISNPHVTVKAEALYVDLGRENASSNLSNYTSRFRNTAIVGRLGLNLKW